MTVSGTGPSPGPRAGGGPHGGVGRQPVPDLRRTGARGRGTGRAAARGRSGPGHAGGAVRGPRRRPDRRDAGGPAHRRRLCPDGPWLPRRTPAADPERRRLRHPPRWPRPRRTARRPRHPVPHGRPARRRARAGRRTRTGLRDDAAYVIYTSGSTGRPKGVLVTARATCRACSPPPTTVRLRPATTCGRCSTPTPSTSRCGRSGARCCTAAGSSSSRTP